MSELEDGEQKADSIAPNEEEIVEGVVSVQEDVVAEVTEEIKPKRTRKSSTKKEEKAAEKEKSTKTKKATTKKKEKVAEEEKPAAKEEVAVVKKAVRKTNSKKKQ